MRASAAYGVCPRARPGVTTTALVQFILFSVSVREVGSASSVLEATQQLSMSIAFALVFRLPTHAREESAG